MDASRIGIEIITSLHINYVLEYEVGVHFVIGSVMRARQAFSQMDGRNHPLFCV